MTVIQCCCCCRTASTRALGAGAARGGGLARAGPAHQGAAGRAARRGARDSVAGAAGGGGRAGRPTAGHGGAEALGRGRGSLAVGRGLEIQTRVGAEREAGVLMLRGGGVRVELGDGRVLLLVGGRRVANRVAAGCRLMIIWRITTAAYLGLEVRVGQTGAEVGRRRAQVGGRGPLRVRRQDAVCRLAAPGLCVLVDCCFLAVKIRSLLPACWCRLLVVRIGARSRGR